MSGGSLSPIQQNFEKGNLSLAEESARSLLALAQSKEENLATDVSAESLLCLILFLL